MFIATDPLSIIFVACFLAGLIFLVLTTLLGGIGGHGHGVGHFGGHHAQLHVGGHGVGHSTAHTISHGMHGAGHAVSQPTGQGAAHPSPQPGNTSGNHATQANPFLLFSFLNPTSIVLFLIGFGFFGYVFHNTAHLMLPLTLVLSAACGLIIAAILLVMLSRIFSSSEANTIQDVSDRTGLLGKVSITIKENSLGEIIYTSPGGMRKSIPAKSVNGERLERGQEVVVVNYQNGIAEVSTWESFINDEQEAPMENSTSDELERLRTLLENTDSSNTELVMRNDLQKE